MAQLFAYPARTEVLKTLYYQPAELGLRQIAVVASLHVRSAELALKDLKQARLVSRRKDKNRVFFSLNREHESYPLLAALFSAEEKFAITQRAAAAVDEGAKAVRFAVTAARMLKRARESYRGAG